MNRERTLPGKQLDNALRGREFSTTVTASAGGWMRLEVRVAHGDREVARATVEHVGIGEVFLIAGQSNSANHGEQRLKPKTKSRVCLRWLEVEGCGRTSAGTSCNSAVSFPHSVMQSPKSLMFPWHRGLRHRATSVREWLPKGSRFPNPPTLEGRVEKTASGEWLSASVKHSKRWSKKMKMLGPHGFRASCGIKARAMRTRRIRLERYQATYIENISRRSFAIRDRKSVGTCLGLWLKSVITFPVMNLPQIYARPSIVGRMNRAAGTDSDALKGELRERNGQWRSLQRQGLAGSRGEMGREGSCPHWLTQRSNQPSRFVPTRGWKHRVS